MTFLLMNSYLMDTKIRARSIKKMPISKKRTHTVSLGIINSLN